MPKTKMEIMVKNFQKYVKSYSDQPYYKTYDEDTFIKDMIYGIGISICKEDYSYAQGFKKFMDKIKSMAK